MTFTLKCTCPDFEPELTKINAPFVLQAHRQPGSVQVPKPFVFCPWCGRRLIDTEAPTGSRCQKCGRPTFGPLCGECKGDYPKR